MDLLILFSYCFGTYATFSNMYIHTNLIGRDIANMYTIVSCNNCHPMLSINLCALC